MTFTWAGGSQPYDLRLSGPGGSPNYPNLHGHSVTIDAPNTPGTYSWTLSDSNGQSDGGSFVVTP